jgi:hypothetical protein
LIIYYLYVCNVFVQDIALQEVHFKGFFAYFSPDQSTSYGLKKNKNKKINVIKMFTTANYNYYLPGEGDTAV